MNFEDTIREQYLFLVPRRDTVQIHTHLYHNIDHIRLEEEAENYDTKAHSWIHLSKHDVKVPFRNAAEELSGRKFKYKVLFHVKMIPTGLYHCKFGYPVAIKLDPPLDKTRCCAWIRGPNGFVERVYPKVLQN